MSTKAERSAAARKGARTRKRNAAKGATLASVGRGEARAPTHRGLKKSPRRSMSDAEYMAAVKRERSRYANPGRKATARGTKRGTKTKDITGRQEWSIKTKGELGADWYSTKGSALRAAAQRVRVANKHRMARPGDFIEVRKVRDTIRAYVANKQGKFVLKADYDKERWTAPSNAGYARQVVRKNIRGEKARRKGAKRVAKKPAPSHRITSRPRRYDHGDF